MNSRDVAALLALVADMWPTLTPRTQEDAQLRVRNWQAALDYEIPYEFAVGAVHRHFGQAGVDEPTPGVINAAWKAEKKSVADKQVLQQITSHTGVPPTAEFYAAWEKLKERNR